MEVPSPYADDLYPGAHIYLARLTLKTKEIGNLPIPFSFSKPLIVVTRMDISNLQD